MASFDAGRVVATADLDRTPFQNGLRLVRDEGRKFERETYQAKVGADTTAADRDLSTFDARLRKVAATTAQARVALDQGEATRKLITFQERLDRMRTQVAEAKVDLDDKAAKAKLDALDIQLRKVGLITARPRVSLEGVERANLQLDALGLKMAAVGSGGGGRGGGASGGGFFSRLPNPSTGLLALGAAGPMAIPLAGAALGGAASFLTPTIAGGLGLGAFGLGAKSSVTTVEQDAKKLQQLQARIAALPASTTTTHTTAGASAAQITAAQARLDNANARLAAASARGNPLAVASASAAAASARASLEHLQARGGTTSTTTQNKERLKLQAQEAALLKSMDPAQRQAVKNIDALEASWKRYQKALEPQTFRVVADGAKLANTGLAFLLPTAKAVGDEVDILERRAEKAFTSPFWHQFFGDFLPGEAKRSVDTLGTSIGNIVGGFAHLSEKFAPLGHDLERALVGGSAKFENWTQGSGPAKFVAWAEKEGPVAGKALEALGKGVSGLVKGFAPIGQLELKALTPVLNFIGKLGDEHPEVITAIGAALLGVGAGLKVIAGVRGVAGIFGGGGGSKGGKGGILGSLSERGGTPANPLYVFVVDNAPGGGIPGIPGGKGGKGGRFAPIAGLSLPLTEAYLATQGGDQAPGQDRAVKGGPAKQALADALSKFGTTGRYAALPKSDQQLLNSALSPESTFMGGSAGTKVNVSSAVAFLQQYDPKTLDALAAKYPQVAAAMRDAAKNAATLNQYLVINTGLAGANAKAWDAQKGALQRELSTLASLPAYMKIAADAAKNGGFVIGKSLTDGITIGIRQGQGKVMMVTEQMVGGALHVAHVTAQAQSPSKKMIQLGRWMAEGLAVGFTGYQANLLKAFKMPTQIALDKLGLQLNAAAGKYRDDLAARASLKTQIAGGITGAANLSNVTLSNTGGATVAGFLGGQVRTDTALDRMLKQLRRRGLDPRLIEQIAEMPPEQGLQVAQQILAGGQAGIRKDNAEVRAIGRLSNSIGGTAANATFAGTLAKDQRSLDRLVAEIAHLVGKKLDLSTQAEHAMERAFEHAIRKAFPSISVKELDQALGLALSRAGG